MSLFRRRGFNILAYDARYHGSSGGPFCSFDFFEKHDLTALVDWVLKTNGENHIVGTHGESLGAATTLQHAALDPRIRFAISDCAFSDLEQLFTLRLHDDYHLPPFPILPMMGLVTRRFLKFDYHAASPIHYISEIQTPILFIHGEKDDYIPPSMSVEMHKAKTKGIRRLYLAPNARHACAISSNPDEYDRQVGLFFREIGLE